MRKHVPKHGGVLHVLEKGETRNPNGRPKKGISLVNAELKAKGYEPAKKAEIEANYMTLIQLEERELKALLEDKTKPMLIRILVKNMLSLKGFDIIEKMLDRGIGKPVQVNENNNYHTGDIEINTKAIDKLNSLLNQKNIL